MGYNKKRYLMKKLHLLIIKSFLGPLILTFFIAEFVLIMQFLWLYIGDLVGKGLELSTVAEFLLYSSANLVKMALPLSILLASIMTFGSLGENYELSAMKSAGISLPRIMTPMIVVSLLLGVGLFFFSNNVIPSVNLKMHALYYDISNKQPQLLIKSGVFNEGIPGFRIKVKSKNSENNMMYDFMIYDHKENRGNQKVTLADSGIIELAPNMKSLVITLYGGKAYEEVYENQKGKKVSPEHRTYFSKEIINLELADTVFGGTSPDLFKHNCQAKSLTELNYSNDSLSAGLYLKKDKFSTELKTNRYFKYSRKQKTNDTLLPRTLINQEPINASELEIVANLDSLFNRAGEHEQLKILNSALEQASSNRKFIDASYASIVERQRNIYKHKIAWHEKFTLPFACLIFFFVGAPLGAIIRKGGFGLPFLVSIVFFLVYYVVSIFGRKFVEDGSLLAWQGMWLSTMLTLPLGIFFTLKAANDSSLFDLSSLLNVLKRPFSILKIRFGFS